MTVLFTYPLVLRMGDSVVGQIGDNIYFIWLIRWYRRALFELHISPFFNPWLNYPAGWDLASTDTVPAVMLYAVPLNWIGGATWAYNVSLLLSFVLSGWIMYLWVRQLTGNEWAGLLAGTHFAFLPYRLAHFLVGHLNLVNTQWLPLYFWGLHDLLRAEKLNWKSSVMAAIALGLISASAPYYIYMTVLFTGVFLAGWLWLERRRLFSLVRWQNLLLFAGLALPLAAIPMLPYMTLNQQGGLASRSVEYASSLSASPTDFLLPSTDHFLFGRWVGAHFDRSLWIEVTLYVGVVGLALAFLAWLKRKETGSANLVNVAVLMIAASFILALGTHLLWLNKTLVLPLPGFLQEILDRKTTLLTLPGYFLFHYFPMYDKMRALARFGFYVPFFVCVMAGLGSAWLLKRVPASSSPFLAAGLLVLAVFDFYPGPYTQFARVDARPVDYWLAEQPGQGAVVQFPFGQNEDQDQVYNTLVHQKPFLGGFFSANKPEQYLKLRDVLNQFPTPEGVAMLRKLGVQYVLVDSRQYPDFTSLDAQIQALGLRLAQAIDSQYVYIFR